MTAATADQRRTRDPRGYVDVDPVVLANAGLLMCTTCCALVPNTMPARDKHLRLHEAVDHPMREEP